jgi:hypothetical protein
LSVEKKCAFCGKPATRETDCDYPEYICDDDTCAQDFATEVTKPIEEEEEEEKEE